MTQHWRNPSGQIIRSGGNIVRCPACPCEEDPNPPVYLCCDLGAPNSWSVTLNNWEAADFRGGAYGTCIANAINGNTFVCNYAGVAAPPFLTSTGNVTAFHNISVNCSTGGEYFDKPLIAVYACIRSSVPSQYQLRVYIAEYQAWAYPTPPANHLITANFNWSVAWQIGIPGTPFDCSEFNQSYSFPTGGDVQVVAN